MHKVSFSHLPSYQMLFITTIDGFPFYILFETKIGWQNQGKQSEWNTRFQWYALFNSWTPYLAKSIIILTHYHIKLMRSIREYFGMRALINCFAFFAVTLSSNTNLCTHTSSSMNWKLKYRKVVISGRP